jgi:hypothetical protein
MHSLLAAGCKELLRGLPLYWSHFQTTPFLCRMMILSKRVPWHTLELLYQGSASGCCASRIPHIALWQVYIRYRNEGQNPLIIPLVEGPSQAEVNPAFWGGPPYDDMTLYILSRSRDTSQRCMHHRTRPMFAGQRRTHMKS